MVNQYKYKFYLNANHAIFINNVLGQMHPHTWEIMIEVLNTKENFVQFDRVETVISKIFERYQDQFINTIEPFNKVNPTLENMVYHFKKMIEEQIKEYYMILLSIEISETPSRSYIINSFDEVEVNYLNMNKYANDEESFIDQIVRENMEEAEADNVKEEAAVTDEPEEGCRCAESCLWKRLLASREKLWVLVLLILAIVIIVKWIERCNRKRERKEILEFIKNYNLLSLSREK